MPGITRLAVDFRGFSSFLQSSTCFLKVTRSERWTPPSLWWCWHLSMENSMWMWNEAWLHCNCSLVTVSIIQSYPIPVPIYIQSISNLYPIISNPLKFMFNSRLATQQKPGVLDLEWLRWPSRQQPGCLARLSRATFVDLRSRPFFFFAIDGPSFLMFFWSQIFWHSGNRGLCMDLVKSTRNGSKWWIGEHPRV